MTDTPCQKIVWDCNASNPCSNYSTAIRQKVSQLEAARVLEIAPSATSRYRSGKRGYRIGFEDDVKRSIGLLAKDLKDGKQISLVGRICDICRQICEEDENQCIRSPASKSERCGS